METKVKSFIELMENCFQNFLSVTFVICESFSNDSTRAILEALQKENINIILLEDTEIDAAESRRTVRIASARNMTVRYVTEHKSEFDYVVVADVDGVNRDLSRNRIESSWEFPGWDMVAANQPFKYYDIWALRAHNWSEGDCWEEFRALKDTFGKKHALKIAVTSKMKSIPTSASPIQVESAFGGIAIYRIEAFLKGDYKGYSDEGSEVCEHVHFHQMLRSNGFRLFINPKLVNLNRRSQILTISKELLLRIMKRI